MLADDEIHNNEEGDEDEDEDHHKLEDQYQVEAQMKTGKVNRPQHWTITLTMKMSMMKIKE